MALKVKSYQIILIIGFTIFAFLIYRAVRFFTAKPNIAVNYVAEWNKISKPENYDPNQNAFFDYERAASYIQTYSQIMYEDSGPNWPQDMNEAQLKILKDWLDERAKALEYFKAGSQKPYYWDEIPERNKGILDIPLPMLSFMRRFALSICWRAKLNAFENKEDEALEDIITCYRAGILVTGKKRFLMEQLVGFAMRALAVDTGFLILSNTKVEPEKLEEYQKQIEELISKRPSKIDFTGEKIFIYNIIQHIFTDDGNGNGHLIPQKVEALNNSLFLFNPRQRRNLFEVLDDLFSRSSSRNNEDWPNLSGIALFGPYRKEHIEILDKTYQYMDDLQQHTPWQLHSKGIDLKKQVDNMVKDLVLFKKGIITKYAIERRYQINVSEEALLTVISSLRFKTEKENFPDSLQELVDAGYLKEIPMDPYSNGPLSYKKTEDGFLLYSFGADFDDDEGTYISYWGQKGGDQVFWPLERIRNREN